MEMTTIQAAIRNGAGKGPARRSRRAGCVPGVLYGGQGETLSLEVNARELARLMHSHTGENLIVQVEVSDKPELDSPALMCQVQHDPIRGQITHIDLVRVRLDEKVQTRVPLVLTGQPIGVRLGGTLDHQLRELEIEAFPLEVPDQIEVDVSELDVGDILHVDAVKAPKGVTILSDPTRCVAAVQTSRMARSTETEAEAGAAAGTEEGQTPAAGA